MMLQDSFGLFSYMTSYDVASNVWQALTVDTRGRRRPPPRWTRRTPRRSRASRLSVVSGRTPGQRLRLLGARALRVGRVRVVRPCDWGLADRRLHQRWMDQRHRLGGVEARAVRAARTVAAGVVVVAVRLTMGKQSVELVLMLNLVMLVLVLVRAERYTVGKQSATGQRAARSAPWLFRPPGTCPVPRRRDGVPPRPASRRAGGDARSGRLDLLYKQSDFIMSRPDS